MCDCNSRCDMRPTRVIPVTGNATQSGVTPIDVNGSMGFGAPLSGNVRGEPFVTMPPNTTVQNLIEQPFVIPPWGGSASSAGVALAESDGGTFTYAIKEHWPWFVVGALAIAAIVWK
jgi:hypothetical protein